MHKNDFWFISLIALLVVYVCSGWNKWASVAVICNSIIVLWDVFRRLCTHLSKGDHHE